MLIIGVVINLSLLISFKYANFITDNINIVLSFFSFSEIDLNPIHLPLGISFFTFQAISYIVDVYRKDVPAQQNPFDLALYISLFPQLIAGPIVRYHDVANQIKSRNHSFEMFSSGVERFIFGLAKKVLIANSLGEVADTIFLATNNDLTLPLAWIGIIAYALQIYFDFSGYSDMAIGLGRMFGFRFLENFNYPYISTSVREFWRRWHISLSTWFRDYLYIPLGGSRKSPIRIYLNLLIVFITTGFWHGASWNFMVWGLFHGFFLASEHAGIFKFMDKVWRPIQHLYLLIIVLIGWVFFRAETLTQGVSYVGIMFDISLIETSAIQFAQIINHEVIMAFVIGLILCMPTFPQFCARIKDARLSIGSYSFSLFNMAKLILLSVLLFLCILKISSSTYNPFIYFRF
ncbi:MAG: MBOAT family protein [Marinicellaceae bacterium]